MGGGVIAAIFGIIAAFFLGLWGILYYRIKRALKNKKKKEKGCTEPLYGKKSKCLIRIVPQDTKTDTFEMSNKCYKKRLDSDD